MDDALRPAVVPDVYVSRYGCSESTASASVVPGHPSVSSSHGATTTCSTDGASRRASSRISSIGTARPRRLETVVVIATLASESCSRCATAGAAKPEKTGTWTAPMCAQACEAIATSGDIGR